MVNRNEFSKSSVNEQNESNLKISRRGFVGGAVGLTATSFLVACGGETSPSASQNISADSRNSLPNEVSVASETEVAKNHLNIDISKLPWNPDMQTGAVKQYIEAIEDISKNNNTEQRHRDLYDLLYTQKSEVLTNGKYDSKKSANIFINKLVASIVANCNPESVESYINTPNDGTFAADMMKDAMVIARALGGYEDPLFSDEDVRDRNVYEDYVGTRRAMLNRYIDNAQQVDGNLNETLKVSSIDFNESSSNQDFTRIDVNMWLTNQVDRNNPPAKEIDNEGVIGLTVYPDFKKSNVVVYNISNEWGAVRKSPFEGI